MNPLVVGCIGILCLFVMLGLRMQIGFAMMLIGFLGVLVLNSFPAAMGVLGMIPYDAASSYTLSVIPLFILMGQFANSSRMGAEVYNTVYRIIGHLPGGLAMATIGACACFAAISGSSLAAAATMGMVALPEMKKFKYSDALATGCIAAGGTLGILIPPSTVLILYGILTEQSITRLFIAGVMPGILLSLIFITTIYIMTKINPSLGQPGPRFTMKEKVKGFKDTWGIMSLFVLVVGGLYLGWFTPTEAAGVGAFGAFVITLIKGRMNKTTLGTALKETASTTAMVFIIIIGASVFQQFMTISQLPYELADWVSGLGVGPYTVMSILVVIFMVMGCFMEGLSIMILAVPIVYPIVIKMGFDPIWFGIIITLIMEMSLITPPVGVNVFILSGVAKDIPMATIFRGVLPFWAAMLACIILLMIFPDIALFLPNTMH